jgi:hypothetical protein
MRALLPFVRRAQAASCELCGAPLLQRHPHVIERAQQAVRCACTACAVLFRGGARFCTTGTRVVRVPFSPGDAEWARLEIPVQLAFLVRRPDWNAFYPSPAGAVVAPLSAVAAETLGALLPLTVEPEIEALIVDRRRVSAFVVPLDRAWELAACVRRTWRGFTGGDEARAAIDAFFDQLEEAAA